MLLAVIMGWPTLVAVQEEQVHFSPTEHSTAAENTARCTKTYRLLPLDLQTILLLAHHTVYCQHIQQLLSTLHAVTDHCLQVAGCDQEVTEEEVEGGEVDQLAARLCEAVEVRQQCCCSCAWFLLTVLSPIGLACHC
jgi:hypothetical protein